MERLVIIDHLEHCVYIEDVSDEDLEKYHGEEEDYIKDNYNLEFYSWDYVTDVLYTEQNGDVVELEIPTEDSFGLHVNEIEGKVS